MTIPVLIPLGNGTYRDNLELRYLLRSLDANAGKPHVYLMTMCAPDWINPEHVTIVSLPDPYSDCKDANLFYKTHKTIEKYHIEDFVWTADDAAIMQPIDLENIPVVHNHRPNSMFYEKPTTKWRSRVKDTLEWAKSRGVCLPHNYECHCPQKFNGKAILDGMKDVSFYPDGKTIYTAWRVATDSWQNSVSQLDVKRTFEFEFDDSINNLVQSELCSKPFIGYSDATAERVFNRLKEIFSNKSIYEK